VGETGAAGGAGGSAAGGALFYTADYAAAPVLTVNASVFNFDGAVGGIGGQGGDNDNFLEFAGAGGDGGEALGGAVYADFQDSSGGIDTFTRDSLSLNHATGGGGGAGGSGGNLGIGGAGGGSGGSAGGGLDIIISDLAAATQLTIARCSITNNNSNGGSGGTGGAGAAGGDGGPAGLPAGGGLLFESESQFAGVGDTWTLDTDTIANNTAGSSVGGDGGAGNFGTGGNGGTGDGGGGGGVYDIFMGTLNILHTAIIHNVAATGVGGVGGVGPGGDGSNGMTFVSLGGGILIDPSATANKTSDTKITGNQAEIDPDVFGTIGSI
jgi:hypothetical protein